MSNVSEGTMLFINIDSLVVKWTIPEVMQVDLNE